VASAHIGILTGFAAVFIYSFSLMVKPLRRYFGLRSFSAFYGPIYCVFAIAGRIGAPSARPYLRRYWILYRHPLHLGWVVHAHRCLHVGFA
jgi:hypothetical protein